MQSPPVQLDRFTDSCAPWCATHADGDCLSPAQVLSIGSGEVGVYLLRTPGGEVELVLDVDSGARVAEVRLSLAQAHTLAGAVNLVVPAPRSSSY